MIFFEWTRPEYLLLFGLLLVLYEGFRWSLVDLPLAQRRLSLLVRSTILSLLVLSLAGTALRYETRQPMIVFLVDRSRSVDEEAQAHADEFLAAAETFAGNTPIRVVPFASTPNIPPEADPSSWKDGTNIAAALETGLAAVPSGYVPKAVILSDGNETEGDVLATARRFGATVSVVPLPSVRAPEVQLDELRLPSTLRQGEPFNVDIVIRSNVETEGVVTLYRGPFQVVEERKPIHPGENVFRFRQTADDQSRQEFSATVSPAVDTIPDNNQAVGLVFTQGKPRVLLLDRDPKTVRDFAAALREQGIVVEMRPPEGTPRTLDEWDGFDAVMLSDIPATVFSATQMETLRTYVRDLGGGLVMLGGEQSFGLGGYYRTPIDEVLPVRSDFEKEREKPTLALCLAIDCSGSMGGRKIELAKDAARSAVELLTPKDYVAVVAFDSQSYVVCPMQSAAGAASVQASISTIEAAAGTNLYPALVDALEQFRDVSAKLKHIILLTDGHSAMGDFDGIVQKIVARQITVSTVGVGGEADNELLRKIAENGGGRYYLCEDPESIPQIFAKETLTASQAALQDLPFLPIVITPSEVLAEIEMSAVPPLLGFITTELKPTAQLILAASTETGHYDPLLAWWRSGLGRSVAFCSDVKSRWAAEWLAWPDYSRFWAQIVRYAMREPDPRGAEFEILRQSCGVRLRLDLRDESDRFVNAAEVRTILTVPEGAQRKIELVQTAPGRYEADVATDKRGEYRFQTSVRSGEEEMSLRPCALVTGYSDELRLRPTDEELLRRVAESTGGRYDPSPEEVFADRSGTVWRSKPLWPLLLTVAAFLLVLDILLRRVELPQRDGDGRLPSERNAPNISIGGSQ